MQDDSNISTNSSLICPDIENLIQQLNDNSLQSRFQLCSLFLLSHQSTQHRLTVSYSIDTLIYLHENYSSQTSSDDNLLLPISSDYCFLPRSYNILFDYLLDIILQYLPPTLILLQIEQQRSSFIYPKNLLQTFSPSLLHYIYDQKLLSQLLKYIQTTTTNERRWSINNNNNNTNKRKLDDDDNSKITDEQFIEKIIQHVSNITQWTDERRRHILYTYIIDERQTLLQLL